MNRRAPPAVLRVLSRITNGRERRERSRDRDRGSEVATRRATFARRSGHAGARWLAGGDRGPVVRRSMTGREATGARAPARPRDPDHGPGEPDRRPALRMAHRLAPSLPADFQGFGPPRRPELAIQVCSSGPRRLRCCSILTREYYSRARTESRNHRGLQSPALADGRRATADRTRCCAARLLAGRGRRPRASPRQHRATAR